MATPQRIENINAEWYYSAPFLSEFLLRFKYVKTDKMPTFGIGFDKSFILYYNETFMDSLTNNQLKGVLVHEIMHIIYIHTVRFETIMRRDDDSAHNIAVQEHMRIYNYAADTTINERITKDLTVNGTRLELPDNCWNLSHELLKEYQGPLVSENIYLYLLDKIPKVNLEVIVGMGGQADGEGGEGDEAGETEGEGEAGKGAGGGKEDGKGKGKKIRVNVFDDHSKMGELDSQEAKELGELIKYTAQVKGWGTMGGDMVGHIKELLAPKKVPLQEILRRMLQMMADGYFVKYDTFNRMNRRGLDLLPGKKKKGTIMNLIVDTSGSCFSEQDQKLFFSEIDYISNRVPNINLIQFDTEVTANDKYKRGGWRKLKLKGSGGTDMQPVFDYLHKKKLNKYPTIIFTDGWFSWNINHYNIEPLWVVNNNEAKPAFGHLFVLDNRKE
jgi:predicted metal-dependent peptidase